MRLYATIEHVLLQALREKVTAFFEEFSVAQRMSWAAGRRLTRIEDEAYCLLGFSDVNMPVLYGEGPRAFLRLQQEILRTRIDHTIFAWDHVQGDLPRGPTKQALLAPSAAGFRNRGNTTQAQFDLRCVHEVNNVGVRMQIPCHALPIYDGINGKIVGDHASREVLALIHCYSGDWLIMLALRLRHVGATDQEIFVVEGDFTHKRITEVDAVTASKFQYNSVTILFSNSMLGDFMSPFPNPFPDDTRIGIRVAIRLEGRRVDLEDTDLACASVSSDSSDARSKVTNDSSHVPGLFFQEKIAFG